MKHWSSPPRQRGFASIIAVLLLITGVLFILGQSFDVIGRRTSDTSQQLDSTRALMQAESAMQRAQGAVIANASGWDSSSCSAFGPNLGSFTVGTTGSFSYSSTATSFPSSCTIILNGAAISGCASCTFQATGTYNNAQRTLQMEMDMAQSAGITGKGTTVTFVVYNKWDTPAIALFNLSWQPQLAGGGGNADASICSTCTATWNVESSNGGNTSAGGMGIVKAVPANTPSAKVVQTLSASRNYAEVGALFPSLNSTSPTIIGSYWDDKDPDGTANNSNTLVYSGNVINGSYSSGSGCVTAPNPYPNGSGTKQAATCTNWCRTTGSNWGDTLIFGAAARSGSLNDQLGPVTFNGVAMTRQAHYPDANAENATGTIYSEVYTLYNAPYNAPGITGAGFTNYTGATQAYAGTQITLNANINSGTNSMVVASKVPTTASICVGDPVTSTTTASSFVNGGTQISVSAIPGGGACTTATGTFTLSANVSSQVKKATDTVMTKQSTLNIIASTATGTLTTGSINIPVTALGSTATIGTYTGGVYTLNTKTFVASTGYVTQGTPGTTILVPTGTSLPSVGTYLNIYNVNSSPAGAGAMATSTTVTGTATGSFTVNTAPTTAMVGVDVCGGTCGLFNAPATSSSVTPISVTKTSGTTQWAGGFVCLAGVNPARIQPLISFSAKMKKWQEVQQ